MLLVEVFNMSILSDIYEENYGEFIEAADKYRERIKKQLDEENEITQQKLNFKLNNLEKMFLNVCENVYKLKANQISVDQLVSVVNGCLDPKVMDRFTWDYLLTKDEQKEQIEEKIKEISNKYLKEGREAMIYADDIDIEESGVDKLADNLEKSVKSKKRIKKANRTNKNCADSHTSDEEAKR